MARTEGRPVKLVEVPPRPPRGRRIKRAAIVLLAAATAASGWAAATWTVEEVRVKGTSAISPDRVIAAAGVTGRERVILMRLGPIQRRVESLAGVRSAVVTRRLPGTVVIDVVERRPLAQLEGTRVAADGDGVLVPLPRTATLPALAGWTGRPRPGATLGPRWTRLLAAYEDFPRSFRERAGRIVMTGGTLTIGTRDGVEVRFGPATDLSAKAHAAEAVLAHAAQAGLSLAYVDVRLPQTPVTGDRAAPSATPRRSPAAKTRTSPEPEPPRRTPAPSPSQR